MPLYSAEHFYIVTDRIEGVHPMLPVMRDPDGFIYYKEEVGGLVMGGFEPKAKPWKVDPIPSTFRFELLGEDWDQFEPLMTNAIHRTPCLETAQVKMLLNGPESFTPDGNFILGEAPELRGYFVAAGFNSAGIANSGGAGRLIAQWIVGGEAPIDLWDVDIRRFGAVHRESQGSRRAHRRDARPALRDALAAPGAGDGAAAAHVAALRPAGRTRRRVRREERLGARQLSSNLRARRMPCAVSARPHWLDWMIDEQRATREAVALYDQSSFAKLLLRGPRRARCAAAPVRQRDRRAGRPHGLHRDAQCARRLRERPDGDSPGTGPLPDRHRLGAGDARRRLDQAAISKRIEHAVLTDVSALLVRARRDGADSPANCSRGSVPSTAPTIWQRLKFSHTREIDLGFARVRAARMSYVGGPGYELYVPVEMTRHVYLALQEAGIDLGLTNAGYYALDALRIEAGRRAWGAELGPDETPFEAGLRYAVKLDKPADFIGKGSAARDAGTTAAQEARHGRARRARALRLGRRVALHRGRIGRRTHVGRMGLRSGPLHRPCVPARHCRDAGPRWHAAHDRPLGRSDRRRRLGRMAAEAIDLNAVTAATRAPPSTVAR